MAKVLKGDFSRRRHATARDGAAEQPVPDYRLKLSLPFSDPPIWRRVVVPGRLTLADLHRVIQVCMGWEDSDTHQFLVGKIFYQSGFGIKGNRRSPDYDEAEFRLYQLEEGMQFIFSYLYDGGDGWEVEIGLEEIIVEESVPGRPVALDGARACPPEAIGDIHQYQALFTAPASADGRTEPITVEIDGKQPFDPEFFDLKRINDALERIEWQL